MITYNSDLDNRKGKGKRKRKRRKLNPEKLIALLCFILSGIIIMSAVQGWDMCKETLMSKIYNNLPLTSQLTSQSQISIQGNNMDQLPHENHIAEINDEKIIPKTEIKEKIQEVKDYESHNEKESTIESKIDDDCSADKENIYLKDGKKIVYLTFDDGPSKSITPEILDILAENDIKATFFVLGKSAEAHPEIIKQQIKDGHVLGNHTYSHRYKYIYDSRKNFIDEVKKTDQILKEILGQDYSTHLFRFPGGSFENFKQPMKEELEENGYKYIDWNALNGDAEIKNPTSEWLINRVKETSKGKEKIVILMHDSETKQMTLKSLPAVIKYFKSLGYEFRTLK